MPIFGVMQEGDLSHLVVEQKLIFSTVLERYVKVDVYLPRAWKECSRLPLLLLNDGQDLPAMEFGRLLNSLLATGEVTPVLCAGVHAGKNRTSEYGTAGRPDFAGRGSKAGAYTRFILEKLIPQLQEDYSVQLEPKGIAGFSLGGLTALDMAWNHPHIFSTAGVFSGSLWWRSRDLGEEYTDETDRIMHEQIKEGAYRAGLRFYFTTGSLDETADRNGNGIIDAIDDTLDLIRLLKEKGFPDEDICYINYEDGRHDVETWARALRPFLVWGWGKESGTASY